jgi:PTH1 family peptidyl-tRNA hydrolase
VGGGVKLVVGLGNPGREYERTPHNIGFAVVEELARRWGCALRRSLRVSVRSGSADAGTLRVLLAQPLTFMNASGDAVGRLMRQKGVEAPDLVVVLDDADLPLGRIRIRPKGGTGGHRGLASVVAAIGTDAFTRVRVGIGRSQAADDLVRHVLTPFSLAEAPAAAAAVARAADAVTCVLADGVDAAMNRFNPAPVGDAESKEGVERTT